MLFRSQLLSTMTNLHLKTFANKLSHSFLCVQLGIAALTGCQVSSVPAELEDKKDYYYGEAAPAIKVVIPEETPLKEIAKKYNKPQELLVSYNKLYPPYLLYKKQVIKIPLAEYYQAKTGETAAAIAAKFSMDEAKFCQINFYIDCNKVVPGTYVLVVPGQSKEKRSD